MPRPPSRMPIRQDLTISLKYGLRESRQGLKRGEARSRVCIGVRNLPRSRGGLHGVAILSTSSRLLLTRHVRQPRRNYWVGSPHTSGDEEAEQCREW